MKKIYLLTVFLVVTTLTGYAQCPTLTGDTSVCINTISTYTTESGMTNYNWTFTSGGTIQSGGTSTSNTIEIDWTSVSSSYSLSVTYDEALGCGGSETATILVEVKAKESTPNAISDNPYILCENETASPLSASGGGLLWYTVAVDGVASTTAPTPNTSTPGTTSYWVSKASTGPNKCESNRLEMVVIVTDDVTDPVTPTLADVNVGECSGTPTAPITTDVCAGTITGTTTTVFPITTQGTTVVTWTFDDGNGNTSTQTQNVVIDDVTDPTPDVASLSDVTAE